MAKSMLITFCVNILIALLIYFSKRWGQDCGYEEGYRDGQEGATRR